MRAGPKGVSRSFSSDIIKVINDGKLKKTGKKSYDFNPDKAY